MLEILGGLVNINITNDKGWYCQQHYQLSSDDTNIFDHSVCYRWWNEVSLLELDINKVDEITVLLGVPLVYRANKNKAQPLESCHWWKKLVLSPKDAVKVSEDCLVEVYNLGCVSFALWRDTKVLAFITATFHCYRGLVGDIVTKVDTTHVPRQEYGDDTFNAYHNLQCYVTVRNYRKELLRCVFMNCDARRCADGRHEITELNFSSETIEDNVELLWRTTNFKNKIPMTCVVDISILNHRGIISALSQVSKMVPSQPDITDYSMYSDEVFRLSVSDAGISCDMVFVRIDEGYSLHSLNIKCT